MNRSQLRRGLCIALASMSITASWGQSLAGLSPQEIERRNAAVGFFLPQASTLAVVRDECRGILKNASPDPDRIALEWWQRNRAELDALNAWLQRYLTVLQATDPAAHRAAAGELLRSVSQTQLQSLRTMFRRQLPDVQGCTAALRRYGAPQADMLQLARAPGYERFAEFPESLLRIEKEPGYAPPEERYRTYEIQIGHFGLLASIDAAQAAMERKDAAGVIAAYASMTDRGDARAALTAGHLFHRGQIVGQEPWRAYYWYYRAYAMGSAAGLNQLGMLWKEGVGVPADPRLAMAAFLFAAADNADPKERAQSFANAQEVLPQLTKAQQSELACLTRGQLDDSLVRPVADRPSVVQRQVVDKTRRVADVAGAASLMGSCQAPR